VKITIEALARAPIAEVWRAWNTPGDIMQWNAASEDWHTTQSSVDLREGGSFRSRMEAKDGSFGFDFGGTYTLVEPEREIRYTMPDGREVETTFTAEGDGVRIRTVFDAEGQNPVEMQRDGWQAILDSFVKHVEQLP